MKGIIPNFTTFLPHQAFYPNFTSFLVLCKFRLVRLYPKGKNGPFFTSERCRKVCFNSLDVAGFGLCVGKPMTTPKERISWLNLVAYDVIFGV